jgi:hypothetical protein
VPGAGARTQSVWSYYGWRCSHGKAPAFQKGWKMKIIGCVFWAICLLFQASLAQQSSDYYNKPVQEIRERIGICWDTVIIHKKGLKHCYQGISKWINQNKEKYGFVSTVFNRDSGVVQLTLISDCKLIKKESAKEYYLVLASGSNSFKISFENISVESKNCMAGQRNAIKLELVHAVYNLPDSEEIKVTLPTRGLGYPECPIKFPTSAKAYSDSLFAAAKADSIREADSMKKQSIRADSIEKADSMNEAIFNAALDTAAMQKIVDSISDVVDHDSIDMHRRDLAIFKDRSILKDEKSLFENRLRYQQFLLINKLSTVPKVVAYLTELKKYCLDKQNLYYSARKIIADKDKYLCALYFKKARDECGRVQTLLYKYAHGDSE